MSYGSRSGWWSLSRKSALHFIPFLGFLFIFVHLLVALGMFIVWLMAIIKASKGEWYKLPFIGDFAEKQAHS